jgi:DNA polymerase III epsilon subunit-like protein
VSVGRFSIIDTETNALPKTDKAGNGDFSRVCMLEVAVVRCEVDALGGIACCGEWSRYVMPPEGFRIDPEAARVNGLSPETLAERGAVAECRAALELHGYLREWSDVIVGQNVIAFDLPVMLEAFARAMDVEVHLLTSRWRCLDTKLIFKAIALKMRRQQHEPDGFFWGRVHERRFDGQHSLGHLHELLCGARFSGAHGALADARATLAVMRELARRREMWIEVVGCGPEEVIA